MRHTGERLIYRYAFPYSRRLAPAPDPVKRAVAKDSEVVRLGGVKVGLNAGNSITSGVKPTLARPARSLGGCQGSSFLSASLLGITTDIGPLPARR